MGNRICELFILLYKPGRYRSSLDLTATSVPHLSYGISIVIWEIKYFSLVPTPLVSYLQSPSKIMLKLKEHIYL